MNIHQKYKDRYFHFYIVPIFMAITFFTTVLQAAEPAKKVKFEVRLASHTPINGWEKFTQSTSTEAIWVSPEVTLTNADVVLAELIRHPNNKCSISLSLTEDGTQKFATLTKAHIGWLAAIMMDGQMVMAPAIKAEIPNGRIVITGDFTEEDAYAITRGIAIK